MNKVEPSVARLMDAYKAAVAARDVDAFLQLYGPEARVFDAWGVWSYEGVPAWRVAIEGWFGSRPSDRLTVSFDDVSTVSTPGMIAVSTIVSYAAVSAEGEQVNAMQNRLTWVLKPGPQAVTIIHEHTSAPIGFEDGKAILQRQTGS